MKIEYAYGFFWVYYLDVDLRSRHSLPRAVREASSAPLRLRGLPWTQFFPQESRTFLSNQLWF